MNGHFVNVLTTAQLPHNGYALLAQSLKQKGLSADLKDTFLAVNDSGVLPVTILTTHQCIPGKVSAGSTLTIALIQWD